MARRLWQITIWLGCEDTKQADAYRWFHLWIGLGLLLSILLLVSSISTYVLVSQRLRVEHLRTGLASQIAALDQQVERGSIQSRAQLAATLRSVRDRNSQRIAWIEIQNSDGDIIWRDGMPLTTAFSVQQIRQYMAARQPIFKTVDSSVGRVLVEVFPFRLPPAMNAAYVPTASTPAPMRHRPATIEVGAFLDGENAALWPLKRNLLINTSAALMLLISLAMAALRFRSYVAGRQLEKEVAIARAVQQDLLPSSKPSVQGFQVAADCVAAARVSGDFFDMFSGPSGHSAFVLGDVSGKGVPAALLMGVMHGAVRASSWMESPAQHAAATQEINTLLYERASTERYATMFWSCFDPDSQHLRYINAGHCPPLLFKASHKNAVLRLGIGGPVLGLLPGIDYQTGSVRIDPGDMFVLFSDGILEAASPAGEEFGEERLQSVALTLSGKSAGEIRDGILAAVQSFTGRSVPDDDRTLCVIVYSGTASRELTPEDRFAVRAA